MKFKYQEETKRGGAKIHQSSKYLRLKNGESVIGLLRGEIYESFQIFEDGKGKHVLHGTKGAKQRFSINIIVKDGGENKAKIFEFGKPVNNKLYALSKEHDLTKTFIKISREGEKLDTVWFVESVSVKPSEATLASLNAIPLNILEPQDHVSAPEFDPGYIAMSNPVRQQGAVAPAIKHIPAWDDVPMPTENDMPLFSGEDNEELPF